MIQKTVGPLTVAFLLLFSVTTTAAPPGAPGDDPIPLMSQSTDIGRVGAWPYGPAYGVDVDTVRDLIFLGSGGVVLILDGADRTNPQLISEDIHTQGLVEDIFYNHADQRLYLACGEGGMEIWDVQDPAQPERLSITEVLYIGVETPVRTIQVYSHFAVVECQWGYVHCLDVMDPTNPIETSFNGTMGNPAEDIHISQEDGMVHASGADNYQRLNFMPDGIFHGAGFRDIAAGALFGTPELLFTGVGSQMFILDLLSPSFLTLSITDVGGIIDIVVDDTFAYFVNGSGLQIYNILNPLAPFFVGSVPESYAYYTRLQVREGYAYIADGINGLSIVDIQNPALPEIVGTYEVLSGTWNTELDGDYAYVAHDSDGLFILELGDQTRPEAVGHLDTPGASVDVALQGGLAYVADRSGGLRIVDVSTPDAPVEIGTYEDVNVSRVVLGVGYAYIIEGVANELDWLHVLDISDPANPTLMGSLVMPYITWNLFLCGNYLYVAGHDDGLRIVDVSDPSNPVEVGSYPLPDVVETLVAGNLLYVTAFNAPGGGFFIFNIDDPENPVELGHYEGPGFLPWHFDIAGGYACVNDFDDVHLLLIEDPENPQDLDEYTMPGDIYSVLARDEFIYVSNGAAGVQILENLLYEVPGGDVVWEEQSSGTTQHLNAVAFADEDRGWAVGVGGTILATTNGGEEWLSQTSGTTRTLTDLSFVDATTGWTVGTEGVVLHTVDGGSNWTPQSSGTSVVLNSVCFADAASGWAVGEDGTVLHTGDGGASWGVQTTPTMYDVLSVCFVDDQNGWATVADYGAILYTVNGGDNWSEGNTGSSQFHLSIHFVDQSTGWAVGTFGDIVKSTNGGLSWQPQQGAGSLDWLYDVHFIDENTGCAVGNDGKIESTTDGGADWVVEQSGIHEQLESVYFVNATTGWAVGDFGTILKARPGTVSVDGEIANSGPRLRLSSFPNPFSPQTTIRFVVPRTGHVDLAVFDVAGRRVRNLMAGRRSPGEKTIRWDGRDDAGSVVGSGAYIIRLKVGDLVRSQKVNLLR